MEPTRESRVTLREITDETVRDVCRLATTEEQKSFVAPNAVSIAQAYFCREAWFRAIYADETPVGFLMLEEDPAKPEYYLWRLMIDERYQRRGFGRRAMEQLIRHVRSRPRATELLTSVVQEEGGPQPFYERLGFALTGEYEHGEAMMRLRIQDAAGDSDGSRARGAPPGCVEGNLFLGAPPKTAEEFTQRLAGAEGGVRVERIVSHGHASPEGSWYDQDQDEWVALLWGSATLEWEDGSTREMRPGDHVRIPAHTKHRVARTDPHRETVWLAVFLERDGG